MFYMVLQERDPDVSNNNDTNIQPRRLGCLELIKESNISILQDCITDSVQ